LKFCVVVVFMLLIYIAATDCQILFSSRHLFTNFSHFCHDRNHRHGEQTLTRVSERAVRAQDFIRVKPELGESPQLGESPHPDWVNTPNDL